MLVYTCILSKKLAFSGICTWKSPVKVIYCLLFEFKRTKNELTTSGDSVMQRKKFGLILLTGWKVGSERLYYSSYVHAIFQCIRCTLKHLIQAAWDRSLPVSLVFPYLRSCIYNVMYEQYNNNSSFGCFALTHVRILKRLLNPIDSKKKFLKSEDFAGIEPLMFRLLLGRAWVSPALVKRHSLRSMIYDL